MRLLPKYVKPSSFTFDKLKRYFGSAGWSFAISIVLSLKYAIPLNTEQSSLITVNASLAVVIFIFVWKRGSSPFCPSSTN